MVLQGKGKRSLKADASWKHTDLPWMQLFIPQTSSKDERPGKGWLPTKTDAMLLLWNKPEYYLDACHKV